MTTVCFVLAPAIAPAVAPVIAPAATKCAKEHCIYLWRLGSYLPSKKSSLKVEPMATLEWCETNIDYINIGANNGTCRVTSVGVSCDVSRRVV